MQATEDNEASDEASVPTENGGDDPDLNVTVAVRRKAAKRTFPFELAAEELLLVSSSSLSPQAEDIPVTKKPRVEDPISASKDEADTKISSHDTTRALSPPDAAAAAADNADANPVKRIPATGQWTPEEDANLNSAVKNTRKKKYGKEYRIDFKAIAALFPGRTRIQCRQRWHDCCLKSVHRTSDWTYR
jgi:hypothetical protein